MYSRATRLRPTARGIHVRSTRGAACACLVSAGARSAAGRPGMGSADYPIGQKRTETGRTRGGCTPEPGTATWSARRPSRREARIELRRSVHAVAQPPPAAPSGAERRGTGCNQGSASRGGSAKVPDFLEFSPSDSERVGLRGATDPDNRVSSDIHDDILTRRRFLETDAPRDRGGAARARTPRAGRPRPRTPRAGAPPPRGRRQGARTRSTSSRRTPVQRVRSARIDQDPAATCRTDVRPYRVPTPNATVHAVADAPPLPGPAHSAAPGQRHRRLPRFRWMPNAAARNAAPARPPVRSRAHDASARASKTARVWHTRRPAAGEPPPRTPAAPSVSLSLSLSLSLSTISLPLGRTIVRSTGPSVSHAST